MRRHLNGGDTVQTALRVLPETPARRKRRVRGGRIRKNPIYFYVKNTFHIQR